MTVKVLKLRLRTPAILQSKGGWAFGRKVLRARLYRVQPQRWSAVDWLQMLSLFDAAFYLAHNPDVAAAGLNPLLHYVQYGAQEGRNPHPLFDAAFYRAHNPDVAAAGLNPLLHYVQYGAQEGRNPHPLFDSGWYVAQHPEAAQTGLTSLEHYLQHGQEPGYDPHPLFDTAFYLAYNPDVAQAGILPLIHYISCAVQEGRIPHRLFDTRFYLAMYPDVERSGKNPLQHYITQGWQEGRDPHPLFDTNFYLECHPDIQAQKINPAIHYASVLTKQLNCNSDYKNLPFPPYIRPRVSTFPPPKRVVIGVVTYNNTRAEYAQYRSSLLLATRELSERHSVSFAYIDNGTASHLGSPDAQFIQLPSRGNIGFGAAHNAMLVYAFQEQNADIYICANPDGVFHRLCLRNLIDMHVQFPHALIEARQFPEEHPKYYHPTKLDTHWASGCCLLIPRAIYQEIGGYDSHFFLYLEDVDYSWRARWSGFQVKMCPDGLFGHHVLGRPESIHTKRNFLESGRYLAWKWGNQAFQQSCETALINDKYYADYSELICFPQELKLVLTPKEQEKICTFDKLFSFSHTRW
jgi:GT2 family glycosyltransferase